MGKKSEPGWLEAAIVVLSEAGGAMHYADIASQIVSRGLRKSVGATPAQTVNATFTTEMRNAGLQGRAPRIQRVGAGGDVCTAAAPGGGPTPA